MPTESSIPRHRRSIRLPTYDYSEPGAYFVTIVAYHRQPLFGQIENRILRLSRLGEIIHEEWLNSANIRMEVELDEFIIMPNHLHAIVWINDTASSLLFDNPSENPETLSGYKSPKGPLKKSLGSLIAGFKSACTTRYNRNLQTYGLPIWQRNYYEHIIRDQPDLEQIRLYIQENPLHWEIDPEFFPDGNLTNPHP